MTPQEEEILVRIIVQCVRAILEANEQETYATQPALNSGSRFIDVVPRQEINNVLHNGRQNGHERDDVRESLRRFLRDSESTVPERMQTEAPQPQKRQLITQEDVLVALREGIRVIALQPDAVVTPLARQVAKEKGVELR